MPEEFIFFAVIIFFSIIESISRSRKARQQGQPGESSELPSPEEWREDFPTTDLPTYDDEPSYEEPAAIEERERARAAYRTEKQRTASQTLLPSDLFEELAGLAGRLEQEHVKARTLDLPKQSPPVPLPEPERVHHAPDRSRRPEPARSLVPAGRQRSAGSERHIVHQAHAGYGTDPSSRAPSEQDGLDPLAQSLGQDARAIRTQLLSHTGPELRQAIILQEVLGKPVALRDE
jgi:hypothetical protein